MDERVLRLRVGIFVLISFIILGVLIFLHVEGFQPQYSLYVKPTSAPGVTKNTPVRKNGLLIGRVANVQTEDDAVSVHLRINKKERIYENETVSFGTESFLGDAVVEILPKTKDKRGPMVGNGQLMTSVLVKPNPMEVIEAALDLQPQIADTLAVFQEAGDSVKKAGDQVSELSSIVENALNDDNSEFKKLIVDARKLSQRADLALANFNRVFENLNEIVGGPEFKGQFAEAMEKLPDFIEDIRKTVADTRDTINSFRKISDRADVNLENLEPFTQALKEKGPDIVQQVNDSLAKIDQAVEDIRSFTDSIGEIGSSDGTLGKLLNERELYDIVLESAKNIRQVTEKFEPVMNDVRTLADSLARDPGQLGVRGAFDRRPQGTGYKSSTNGRAPFRIR